MENLLVSTQKEIRTLIINRPECRNAFNAEIINKLQAELDIAAKDPAIHVVVLRGAGDHFSAGADLAWMKNMQAASPAENLADAQELAKLLKTIADFSKVTIVCAQGAVIGGAVGIAAAADFLIASDDAFFQFSEVRLGLVPAVISPYILRAIGQRATTRYFLTAEKFTALKAKKMGLVHFLTLPGQIEESLNSLLNNLRQAGPDARLAVKELLKQLLDNNINDEQKISYTAELIAKLRVSPEGQEGLTAFFEKRKANWLK